MAHKCSLSTRTQEIAYKLLTQWYATPVNLHTWFPQYPDTCWCCNKERGSLLQIWCQCPVLAPFWSEVRKKVFQITETKLKLDAVGCLLHASDLPIKKYKHSLSMHLLNAAKALIPLYWKSTCIPTIQDWFRKVSEVCEMEETIAQTGDNAERFHNKWSPWFIYKYSQAYIDLMNIH